MKIDSAQQMLQHIDAGGGLSLGKDGQLKTQNAAAQFFQKIGDAFRSLTASGQASISARNERLYGAMAEMVRQDNSLPNLAAAGPQQGAAISQAEKNALCMRLEVGRQVASLPLETRTCARNYLQGGLERAGQLEGTPEQVRARVRNAAQMMRSRPDLLRAFRQDGAMGADARAAMMRELTEASRREYARPVQKGHIEDGVHDSYLKDARRGSITSINGQPPRMERLNPDVPLAEGEAERIFQGLQEQICEFIPNPTIRGFVTMMASQAGLEGSLLISLMQEKGVRHDPQALCGMDMAQHGLSIATPHHKYSLEVTESRVDIHLSFDAQVTADRFLGRNIREGYPKSLELGGGHYEVTLSVPLDQQVAEGQAPDFTVSELTRTPLQP